MLQKILPDTTRNRLRSAKKKARHIQRRVHVDLADKTKTVWLFGNGRSGSTWVSSIINNKGKYKYFFEPFHPGFIDDVSTYPLFPYVPPDGSGKKIKNFYDKVFSGRINDKRVTARYLNKGLVFRRRLVKDIFANLFAPYVAKKYPKIKTIFLMRHPCAVAMSKSRLKEWTWMEDPSDFLYREKLFSDLLYKYKRAINSYDRYFEKQIVVWCITNIIPIIQMDLNSTYVLFYEELVSNTVKEASRLFGFLDHGSPGSEAKKVARFSEPSPTSQGDRYKSSQERLEGWKENLQPKQIERAVEILQEFGLAKIYSDAIMPNRQGLASFS